LINGASTSEFATLGSGTYTKKRTYCVTLLSILGSLSEKYLPLFAMTSAPLRLELQLVSNPNKFICCPQAMTSFRLTNVEYVAQMMELGDAGMSIINASVGSAPLQFVIPQYRNYVGNTNLPDGSSKQISLPVPAKFNSLKSLYMTVRQKADGAATFFPFGSCRFTLSEYNLRVGSKVMPSKSPNTVPEFFTELLKSIGSVSDINHECMIDLDTYDVASSIANIESTLFIDATSSCSSFMIGIDLETYSNADKDSIFAGYNTSNDDIFFQLSYGAVTTGAIDVRFDTYALYDCVLICENGVASIRF
jgi:hypothetical protein